VIAFARSPEACPRCGHDDVRRSRRPRGVLLRLLGLRRHRCMACGLIVVSPQVRRGDTVTHSARDRAASEGPPYAS